MLFLNNNFSKVLNQYRHYLKKLFPYSIGYISNGELFIKLPFKKIWKFLYFLKLHNQSQYKVLSDICVVDFPWKINRFQIVYNLLSILYNTRITIICNIKETFTLNSITDIYKVAGWFEREIWDMFGIYFKNNKDLRRILTDYGFKGHPLRKDFPLTGYTEVRYSNIKKRILMEEVSLTQNYRFFYYNNPWTKNI